MAAQVPLRVEPALLYAAPFLVAVPRAMSELNRLQYQWGCKLLGCHTGPRIKWSIVSAQCGWTLRLGTRLLERAIMLRARLQVLPTGHPAAAMLQLATCLVASTWASDVREVMVGTILPDQIPELLDHPAATPDKVEEARHEPQLRKRLLKEYKLSAVRPVLLQFDRLAYFEASRKELTYLGWSFGALLARPTRISIDLLKFDAGPGTWRWYRLWAVCRMTGRWPMQVLGIVEALESLDMCAEHVVS